MQCRNGDDFHTANGLSSMPRLDRGRTYFKLSFAQEQMWFLHQMNPLRCDFNGYFRFFLGTAYQESVLKRMLTGLLARHESLRARMTWQNDGPCQLISPVSVPRWDLIRFVKATGPALKRALDCWLQTELAKPFHLETGPLCRFQTVYCAGIGYYLFGFFHQAVAGDMGARCLAHELWRMSRAELTGRAIVWRANAVQAVDVAAWQRQRLSHGNWQRLASFWRAQFSADPEPLAFTGNGCLPMGEAGTRRQKTWVFSPSRSAGLRALAKAHNMPLIVILLTLVKLVFFRYTWQSRILVAGTRAQPGPPKGACRMGFFHNCLLYVSAIGNCPHFLAALRAVNETYAAAQQHAALPFDRLLEILGIERGENRHPFLRVLFLERAALCKTEHGTEAVTDPLAEVVDWPWMEAANPSLLTLELDQNQAAITLRACFLTAVFQDFGMERLWRHVCLMADAMTCNIQQDFRHIPLMRAGQRQQILVAWNQTGTRFKTAGHLWPAIGAQIVQRAAGDAIFWRGGNGWQSMTYAAFGHRVTRLARWLQGQGAQSGKLVAVCMARSPGLVVALHAIVKAGAAFFALDPDLPYRRLRYMLTDADPHLLLTGPGCPKPASGLPGRVIAIADIWSTEVAVQVPHASIVKRERGLADTPAYLIYTSGSSGQPKGVVVGHRAITNRLCWMQAAMPLRAGERVLHKTPLSFDVAVWELFWSLRVGASLVICPPARHTNATFLVDLVTQWQISAVHFVPALLHGFLKAVANQSCVSLRYVIASGESLPPKTALRCREILPKAALFNLYGPTEAAIDVTCFRVANLAGQANVPIGRPIANTAVYVLDSHLEPVPPELCGVLHIAGRGLAMGYCGQAAKTAAAFIPNPFVPGRMYCSGDLAKYSETGVLTFLGRHDRQVKIRGCRVEPAEIEDALVQYEAVKEVAVTAVGNPATALAAFVVPEEGRLCDETALRQWLVSRLPRHLVPQFWQILSALPRNTHGKIQYNFLVTTQAAAPHAAFVAPQTPAEKLLARIWAAVLHVPQVGRFDQFFELGGNSVLALEVIARLGKVLRFELGLNTFLGAPVLATMAGVLNKVPGQSRVCDSPTAGPPNSPVALSEAQWFLWSEVPPGLRKSLQLGTAIPFTTGANARVLADTIGHMIKRQAVLRTCFRLVSGEVRQMVGPSMAIRFPVIDLSALDKAALQTERQRLRDRLQVMPFDLGQAPLMRLNFLQTGNAGDVLLLSVHVLIADGRSLQLLEQEISADYRRNLRGESLRALPSPVQYHNYAAWEAGFLAGEIMVAQSAYWHRQLSQSLFPVARAVPRGQWQALKNRIERYPVYLDKKVITRLSQYGAAHRIPIKDIVLTAFALVYRSIRKSSCLAITLPLDGRAWPGSECLIGPMIQFLPVVIGVSGAGSFSALLRRVRGRVEAANQYQHLPFACMSKHLNRPWPLSQHPLLEAVFDWQTGGIAGNERRISGLSPLLAHLPLGLHLWQAAGSLSGVLACNPQRLPGIGAERLAAKFTEVCKQVARNPEIPTHRLLANP